MGYCYGGDGRLACDACGTVGGVRKRTCPHRVRYQNGSSLPYCPAPALCRECNDKHRATLHAKCAAGAAVSQAHEDKRAAILGAGGLLLRAAWGDWHANVPEGLVGCVFQGNGERRYRLLTKQEHERAIWDTPLADLDAQPWAGPDAVAA